MVSGIYDEVNEPAGLSFCEVLRKVLKRTSRRAKGGVMDTVKNTGDRTLMMYVNDVNSG